MAMTDAPLLARLSALFDADPLIDEIGLLFDVTEEDLTPDSAFQYAEHKLGVAFCAGVPLFQQARTRFHELNPLVSTLRRRLSDELANDESEPSVVADLLQCSRAILLISADFYTAWNTRKALVSLGYLDAMHEVRFTNLVFTLHPKSIDTWAYRRWLAIRLLEVMANDEERKQFLNEQISVCERLAEQKPRNYHAWSFRHWIVTKFATVDEVRNELKRMNKWCERHITDHSGWNHRQHAVNQLLRRSLPEEGPSVLKAEYELLSGIMALYPAHEALWCHRRFIIHLLLRQYDSEENANSEEVAGVCQRIKDMEHCVSEAGATPTALQDPSCNIMGSAALHDAWRAIRVDLFGDVELHDTSSSVRQPPRWSPSALVASVCVREIEVAWRCESKYARRYAAWCLARLRSWTRTSQMLKDSLGNLSSVLRKVLEAEDETLRDLWIQVDSVHGGADRVK